MIGKTVSHYRILERIGGGGMGVVYKAEDLQLGRVVAIKFLPPELAEDESAKERFQHEARTASALDHANICTIYEAGETEDGQLYLAMAFYEGETLKQRIARGPLPVGEAIELAGQVAHGLARAHAAGIYHRDIKPANIVVTEHGEAKILDFGLAKLAEGARLTRSGTTVGTPAYMSPEQVRGEEIDGRADLWSLGVVLFEMLSGRLPFRGGVESAVIHSILNEEPPDIASLRPELPASVAELIGRALQKNPADRLEDAGQVLQVLQPMRGDTPTEAFLAVEEETRQLPAATAPARAKRTWSIVGIVVLLAAIAAWWLVPEAPNVEPVEVAAESSDKVVTVLPFTFRGNSEYDYLADGIVDLLSTKLDGAGDLRASDPHAVLSLVEREDARGTDPIAAGQVAGALGAHYFVTGEILEAGGNLHVSASLFDRGESSPTSTHTAEGPADELFGLVDEIAAALLAEQIQAPSVKVFSTAAMTTESLPALRMYLKAESELRRGEFTQALRSYQETVELDPEFALAWYRLSVAAEWSTQNMLVGPAVAKALEYEDRLSEHDRDLLAARLANRRGDPVRSEEIYRSILGRYPDDVEAWIQLSEIQSHYGYMTGESMITAREALEKITHYEPNFVGAWWHLARVAAVEEKPDEVDAIVQRILDLNPGGERALEMEALRAVMTSDEEAFDSILMQLEPAEDHVVLVTAWTLAMSRVDPTHALRVLEIVTRPRRSAETRALAHASSAWLELSAGRYRAALDQLERAGRIAPVRRLENEPLIRLLPWVPYDEAQLSRLRDELLTWDAAGEKPSANPSNFFAEHNDIHQLLRAYLIELTGTRLGLPADGDQSSVLISRVKNGLAEGNPSKLADFQQNSQRIYRAWRAGDLDKVLELQGAAQFGWAYQDAYASPFYAAMLDRWIYAEALRQAGQLDEALRWYSTFGEISFHDEAFVGPASLRMAQIHDERGASEEAIRYYQRIAELWRDCDPELRPWVEEAEARLGALGASG